MKKVINGVIFLVIFYVVLLLYTGFLLPLLIQVVGSSLYTNDFFLLVVRFIFPIIPAALALAIFRLVHLRVNKGMSETEKLSKNIRGAKIKSIVLLATFALFFLESKGSVLLYKLANCSGGVGSGISCVNTSLEGLVTFTQFSGFILGLMGFGTVVYMFLYFGLYYLIRYFVLKKKQVPMSTGM